MILPIVAYGHPVLKEVAKDIEKDYPELDTLLENMWETMYNAHGVGLAAPQIGKSIRIFVIDASPFADEEPALKDFKKAFINAHIIEETGEDWDFNEGCLSIPEVREDVTRPSEVLIEYYNENWEKKTEKFDGLAARIIQHEYDHIDGILFTDHLTSLRKRMINGKLKKIQDGKIDSGYRMKLAPSKKKKR
ncbi:MAG: peptide deformylase [Flavobacteriales bacterium]|jgi:peptide deformylase|nr:peptide deformylase [Flavobacteriales bacterium]